MSDTIASVLKDKGHDVWSLAPDASVYEAIRMMADRRVGALLVITQGRLVGIVSERDYARRVILQGRSATEALVRDVMTSPVLVVPPSYSVDDCMRIMTEKRIRHLPVVDNGRADGRVVGMISIGDLVKRIIAEQGETIHQLEGYITGKYPG